MSDRARRPKTITLIFWLYTALLLIATHVPGDAVPPMGFSGIDKLQHAGAYALWTALLLAGPLLGERAFRARALRAVGLATILGAFDELTQAIPALNRSADPLDFAADVAGSVCAVCAFWAWRRLGKRPLNGA